MRIEYLQPGEEDFEDALADVFDEKPKPKPKKKGKTRGPEDSPFHVVSLKPIQMPNLDLDAMVDLRREFTTQEWMHLLLRSCGYEPDALKMCIRDRCGSVSKQETPTMRKSHITCCAETKRTLKSPGKRSSR